MLHLKCSFKSIEENGLWGVVDKMFIEASSFQETAQDDDNDDQLCLRYG